MKKIIKFILYFVFITLAVGVYSQDVDINSLTIEQLREKYKQVLVDRENILAQSKNLMQHKGNLKKAESDVISLTDYNNKLKTDKDELLAKIKGLEEIIEEFRKDGLEKIEQIDGLKKHIENMEIEYKIVKETKRQLKSAQEKSSRLEKKIIDSAAKSQKTEGEMLEAKAAAEAYRRQIEDLRKQYREALALNRQFERKLDEVPRKFAEIARENKTLIKETALMHYNLGVFYLENQEYRRAVSEFEKTLELNPDDGYAHFNLGYIYAEYLVERPKAVDHFRQYLRLTKKDDKDVDWVKKYIITWQAWSGQKPLK